MAFFLPLGWRDTGGALVAKNCSYPRSLNLRAAPQSIRHQTQAALAPPDRTFLSSRHDQKRGGHQREHHGGYDSPKAAVQERARLTGRNMDRLLSRLKSGCVAHDQADTMPHVPSLPQSPEEREKCDHCPEVAPQSYSFDCNMF